MEMNNKELFEIIEKANVGTVTAEINTENNSITWNIETLSAGQTATFKYKLTLKDKFDEKIINVETPTFAFSIISKL